MVIAYHVIFTTYGFWLPNDPRGSWSDFVRAWELRRFGKATHTHSRVSVAAKPHDRAVRQQAKESLKFEPVRFTGKQAQAVSHGFREAVRRSGYRIFACAILPQHVHLVIDRASYKVEYVMGQLKGEATKQLLRDGLYPPPQKGKRTFPASPWAQRSGWKVYLNSVRQILAAIRYVEQNPMKEGKPQQCWSYVVPYAC